MPGINREQIAADWAVRGFSCDLWTDPPGQRWEDFRHATDELVTVLEGNMEFEISGKVERPQSGQELLIPAGAIHSAGTSARPQPAGCTATSVLLGEQFTSPNSSSRDNRHVSSSRTAR